MATCTILRRADAGIQVHCLEETVRLEVVENAVVELAHFRRVCQSWLARLTLDGHSG